MPPSREEQLFSGVTSTFAPDAKLLLHHSIREGEQDAFTFEGLVHDGVQLGSTKMSFGPQSNDLSPIRVGPRFSVTQNTVASVERYGFDLNFAGSNWMKVAMVGMA